MEEHARISDGESTLKPCCNSTWSGKGSIGLALGYGRKLGLQDETQTGENAFVFQNQEKPRVKLS